MKKILIIDDENSFRVGVAKMLEKRGYETLAATNGEEGVELARSQLPDLVLSDVNMDGLDGFGVLRQLRAGTTTSAIPVILMTGLPEAGGLRAGMEGGADDYLPKPFSTEALLASVQARLQRQQTIQACAKANEARLLEILAATQDLVAISDAETGHFLYLNPAGRKMLGVGPEEDVLNLALASFQVAGQTEESATQQISRTKGKGIWLGEATYVSRDKRRIPVSQQILAHHAKPGDMAYLSVVARDVTERQAMELQLRQAQKLEAIGQLAAGIAHEINTPTQYVGDNTRFFQESFQSIHRVLKSHEELLHAAQADALTPELVARAAEALAGADLDYLTEQIPAAIGQTLEGVERITKIVRAMKEFSHPGGKEKSPADLNKAIESTVTVARNEWKYVADMKLELDPDLPKVACLLGEFNQAMLNLVINAAHAIGDVVKQKSGSKGTITVTTQQRGDQVEIRVRDTGTGIPESARGHIFEPFFTTKPVGKGTGQGLTIVYASIVKKHGGTVTFESEVGQGTTFILRLPILPASAPAEPRAATSIESRPALATA